eukprot:15129436-Ditylum_brightwellii.AAC.1
MSTTWKQIKFTNKGMKENNLNLSQITESLHDDGAPIIWDTTLKDPKQAQSWHQVEQSEEIMHYLKVRNQCHFGQTQGTLFTVSPLSQYFDWGTNYMTPKLVSEGDLSDTELSNLEQLFFDIARKNSLMNVLVAKLHNQHRRAMSRTGTKLQLCSNQVGTADISRHWSAHILGILTHQKDTN